MVPGFYSDSVQSKEIPKTVNKFEENTQKSIFKKKTVNNCSEKKSQYSDCLSIDDSSDLENESIKKEMKNNLKQSHKNVNLDQN